MRNLLKTTISLLALVSFLGLSSSAFGVASFARQTGLDCSSCHAATGYPALSSFGMAFKAGGYVQGNEDTMIGDGEGLSIPANLNLSVVNKLMAKRISSKKKVGDADEVAHTEADWAFPDEAAIFLAGRVGKNTGYVLEMGDAHFNSFKIVTVLDVAGGKLGIVPWLTDAFGPAWVFEVLSTGAVRNIRDAEDRSAQSAMQNLGYAGMSGDSSGLGFYYWTPMFHVAVTPFTDGLEGARTTGTKFGTYVRAGVTPNIAGFDMGFGFQMFTGAAEANGFDDGDGNAINVGSDGESTGHGAGYATDMMAVDYQLMGDFGSMPALFTFTWATMGGQAAADWATKQGGMVSDNTLDADGNLDAPDKLSVIGIGLDLAVVPDKIGVMLGYTMALGPAEVTYNDAYAASTGNTADKMSVKGDGSSELMFGVKYNVHRNYRVQLEHTIVTKNYTTSKTTSGTTTDTATTSSEGQTMIMVFGSW